MARRKSTRTPPPIPKLTTARRVGTIVWSVSVSAVLVGGLGALIFFLRGEGVVAKPEVAVPWAAYFWAALFTWLFFPDLRRFRAVPLPERILLPLFPAAAMFAVIGVLAPGGLVPFLGYEIPLAVLLASMISRAAAFARNWVWTPITGKDLAEAAVLLAAEVVTDGLIDGATDGGGGGSSFGGGGGSFGGGGASGGW